MIAISITPEAFEAIRATLRQDAESDPAVAMN
jgi:hypothetical protein